VRLLRSALLLWLHLSSVVKFRLKHRARKACHSELSHPLLIQGLPLRNDTKLAAVMRGGVSFCYASSRCRYQTMTTSAKQDYSLVIWRETVTVELLQRRQRQRIVSSLAGALVPTPGIFVGLLTFSIRRFLSTYSCKTFSLVSSRSSISVTSVGKHKS
jgi:hypothetical protein